LSIITNGMGCIVLRADRLEPETIERRLATRRFGRHIIYLPSARSTNDVAKEAARSGAVEGTVVITDEQTAGRGRLGRTWLAPAGSSALMSLVVRPPLSTEAVFRLTMLTGSAVAAAVETVTGLTAGVKWPNDVFVNGRKVAGILSEASLIEGRVDFVVIGIGMNVNADLSVFDEIAATATSLSSEVGRPVDRTETICQTLLELERRYLPLCGDALPRAETATSLARWQESIYQEWRSWLITCGQWVSVDDGRTVVEGLAEDVDVDGALLVRLADGALLRVAAGDVSLRTPRR
jgi:BirA family transcriptional regulator, biotin operon repressor / biotin---[acetyl-CoA-carboxylase] ligase